MEINNFLTILDRLKANSKSEVVIGDLVEKSISMLLNESFDEALNTIVVAKNNKKDISLVYVNFALEYGIALASIGIYNTPTVITHLNGKLLKAENEVVQNLLKGVLKWITPSNELDNIFKSIKETEGFTFDEANTQNRLFVYIGLKIQSAIIENLRINFPLSLKQSEINFVVKEIANVNRRKQKSNQLDAFIASMKSIIEPELDKFYEEPKSVMTFYHNINSREIDDLLIPIYKEYLIELTPKIVYRNMKKILQEKEKLRLAYPLFALVLKDKNWNSNQYIYGNEKGKSDFRQQDQRLRKFIYKK